MKTQINVFFDRKRSQVCSIKRRFHHEILRFVSMMMIKNEMFIRTELSLMSEGKIFFFFFVVFFFFLFDKSLLTVFSLSIQTSRSSSIFLNDHHKKQIQTNRFRKKKIEEKLFLLFYQRTGRNFVATSTAESLFPSGDFHQILFSSLPLLSSHFSSSLSLSLCFFLD